MINQQTIEQAAAIIRAIGGTVIGRTKLQKLRIYFTQQISMKILNLNTNSMAIQRKPLHCPRIWQPIKYDQ